MESVCAKESGQLASLGMLMAGVAALEEDGWWCSLVKLRISSDPRGAAAILVGGGGGGCRNDRQCRENYFLSSDLSGKIFSYYMMPILIPEINQVQGSAKRRFVVMRIHYMPRPQFHSMIHAILRRNRILARLGCR